MANASLPDSTDGLYNTLCSGLKLSNQQFQMIQGVLPVQSNPAGLYNFFDGIPRSPWRRCTPATRSTG